LRVYIDDFLFFSFLFFSGDHRGRIGVYGVNDWESGMRQLHSGAQKILGEGTTRVNFVEVQEIMAIE